MVQFLMRGGGVQTVSSYEWWDMNVLTIFYRVSQIGPITLQEGVIPTDS